MIALKVSVFSDILTMIVDVDLIYRFRFTLMNFVLSSKIFVTK